VPNQSGKTLRRRKKKIASVRKQRKGELKYWEKKHLIAGWGIGVKMTRNKPGCLGEGGGTCVN